MESPANNTTLNKSVGRNCPIRSLSRRLGSVQRKAVHRPGDIHHKDVLARRYVLGRYSFRRLGHVEKEVLILHPDTE